MPFDERFSEGASFIVAFWNETFNELQKSDRFEAEDLSPVLWLLPEEDVTAAVNGVERGVCDGECIVKFYTGDVITVKKETQGQPSYFEYVCEFLICLGAGRRCKPVGQALVCQWSLLTALFLTIGVKDIVVAIKYSNASQKMNSVLRRFFLVRLSVHYKEIDESWPSIVTTATSLGTKRTTWVLNQMMSRIDSSLVHPVQQSQALPEYKAVRKHLKNQLNCAHNYQTLVDRFGLAILAVVLTGLLCFYHLQDACRII